MRFKLSLMAEQDISGISEFIRRDNPVRALSFTRELRTKIAQAAQTPLSFRERTELKSGIRAVLHGKYLVFFRINDEMMEVLRVWHSARDTTGLFEE